MVVLGGAKVTDKIALIDRFLDKADALLIGGAMCFSSSARRASRRAPRWWRTRASSWRARRSRRRRPRLPAAAPAWTSWPATSFNADAEHRELDGIEVPDGWMGLDIGPEDGGRLRATEIERAGTVFWNGPMGAFELEPFAAGTRAVAEAVADAPAAPRSWAGATRARRSREFGLADRVDHLSTGGGAALELLEGKRAARRGGRSMTPDAAAGRCIAGNWKLWGTRARRPTTASG